MATLGLLYCSKCGDPFPPESCNTRETVSCARCGTLFQALVFPAILRRWDEPLPAQSLLESSEASCFYHAEKKAAVVCDSCGVFLCSLCDVQLKGQHLCSRCIQKGQAKGKIKDLENQRVIYDDLALAIAVVPLLIFYFTFITAPIALYIGIRYWKSPGSIIPRGRFRMVLAILIASMELIGWVFGLTYLATHWS